MAENPKPPPSDSADEEQPRRGSEGLEHASIAYERGDVRARWVVIASIAFVFLAAGIFVGVYAFFRADTDRLAIRRESEFPLAEHPSTVLPANPRLEQVDRLAGIASENVYIQQQASENQLNRYGDSKEKGYVHIPISRAMQLLADHLPVRKQTQGVAKDNGLVDSGASNSGRMLRGAPP
jgi:hypothetical protein